MFSFANITNFSRQVTRQFSRIVTIEINCTKCPPDNSSQRVRQFSRSVPLQKKCKKCPPDLCPPRKKPIKKICPCDPPKLASCKGAGKGKESTCGPGKGGRDKASAKLENKGKILEYITVLFCLPLIIYTTIFYVYLKDEAESRPEYFDVPYMRLRTHRFPWGDGNHTLFHNNCYNPVPGVGYEDDLCPPELLEKIKKKSEEEKYSRAT